MSLWHYDMKCTPPLPRDMKRQLLLIFHLSCTVRLEQQKHNTTWLINHRCMNVFCLLSAGRSIANQGPSPWHWMCNYVWYWVCCHQSNPLPGCCEYVSSSVQFDTMWSLESCLGLTWRYCKVQKLCLFLTDLLNLNINFIRGTINIIISCLVIHSLNGFFHVVACVFGISLSYDAAICCFFLFF